VPDQVRRRLLAGGTEPATVLLTTVVAVLFGAGGLAILLSGARPSGASPVFGPVAGALTLHGLGELTKAFAGRIPGIDLIVFGTVLVLAIAFAPGGILGLLGRLRAKGAGLLPAGSKEVSHAGR